MPRPIWPLLRRVGQSFLAGILAGGVWSLRLLALGVLLASLVALPLHLWTLGIGPWRTGR